MRFRRRIRICKGLSLNVSGSGISASIGVRGASVTVGKNGTYANYGIPGTGIYDRKNFSSRNNNSSYKPNTSPLNTSSNRESFQVSVDLDSKGNPVLKVFDINGNLVTDERILNKVKRDHNYKDSVLKLSESKKLEIESLTDSFINIYKRTENPIIDFRPYEIKLRALKLQKYTKLTFNVKAPNKEDIISQLEKEAIENISSIFFWANKSKRRVYVLENTEHRYKLALKKWETDKQLFELDQLNKEKLKNEQYLTVYNARKIELEGFLSPDADYIHKKIETVLGKMTLPVDFSIDYELNIDEGNLSIDLDLPEIEDIPTCKVNMLASGKISIKQKTSKDISNDYARCVCGLAFFFTGIFFNISSKINKITIAGYTQRVDAKDGNTKDDYIYAVSFDRISFSGIDYKNIDPVLAIQGFPHVINITKTNIFKSIDPEKLAR